MNVSITGLNPKGIIVWISFWAYKILASKDAQKAEGILHCEFNSRNGYQHTLTVWKSKEHMLGFLTSPPHLQAMKNILKLVLEKYTATKLMIFQAGMKH
jgi:hypothetical protein